jgi:cytochrome c-type biogenesis protein CcsB
MLELSQYGLIAGLITIVLALVCYIAVIVFARSVKSTPVMAHVGGRESGLATDVPDAPAAVSAPPTTLALYGTYFTWLGLLFLTGCLVLRSIHTGQGPFTNQYEFSVSFAWGMVLAYAYFEHRYHVRTLALLILPITIGMLLYALSVGATVNPLMPALQSTLLLTIHVAVAILAYGAFSVSFAAAVLYLAQPEGGRLSGRGLPKPELLDEIGYRAIIIGFPLLTLTVVLGAVWAEIAWGTYWSWDPKETASLVTWLIYGAYLHARVARGWVGNRSAWLLVLGFAAVMFTFFGNLFFTSLHSYA